MSAIFMRLPLFLAEKLDELAWKHLRCYRRREQRKRLEIVPGAPRPRCELCNSPIEVLMLKGGGCICMSCQDGFR